MEDDSDSSKQSLLITSDDPNIGLKIYKKLEGLNSNYELNRIKPNLYRLKIDNPLLIKENLSEFKVVIG